MKPSKRLLCLAAGTLLAAAAVAAATRTIDDEDTRRWWKITADLSGDAMEGRDTGSAGYARAADYVSARFRAAGLLPAGEGGGYRQTVPLHEVAVARDGTSISVNRADGTKVALKFLHEISVRPTRELPQHVEGALVFRGYCSAQEMGTGLAGRIALCFGSRRQGTPDTRARMAAARAAGAAALVVVDDPGFTLEPARWPEAYARSVTIADDSARETAEPPLLRLSAAAFATVIAGSGQDAAAILKAGSESRPLPHFDVPARLAAEFRVTQRDYSSDNVLGMLKGTDPQLAPQVVVVSAHLDGYGYGESVDGDSLYNGTLDDAAYVATLVRLAERRHGHGFKRSVLFAAFTGEEKGLLGAVWFTHHPTVARESLAADINLDQLRPLFPLKILTMHALDDTTLGATARGVAARLHIEIRPDREPERHLNQRADHWPFLKIGVPATGFVFGYDPGTESERRYREWYQVRYHRPQDDLGQPMDFVAARDFNRFFYLFAQAVSDAAERPQFLRPPPSDY